MRFQDHYLDADQASKLLGCHPETIKRHIRAGNLPASKIANKWFIEKAELHDFGSTYDCRVGRPLRRSP